MVHLVRAVGASDLGGDAAGRAAPRGLDGLRVLDDRLHGEDRQDHHDDQQFHEREAHGLRPAARSPFQE